MVTYNQFVKKRHRRQKHHKTKTPALNHRPQRLGIIQRVLTIKPKNLILHNVKLLRFVLKIKQSFV
jgi:ribosomal protein S12